MSRALIGALAVLVWGAPHLSALAPQIRPGSDLVDGVERPLGAVLPQEKDRVLLVLVDRVRLARAEVELARDRYVHSRSLFEKQFITRGEVGKDELTYNGQVGELTEATGQLLEALQAAEDKEPAVAALEAVLLRPVQRIAPEGKGPTEEDRMYDRVAEALLLAAPTPEKAVAAHLHRLRSPVPEVRVHAASVLGQLDEPSVDVVPPLIDALADEELRVVQEAITSLGLRGPDAGRAIPALEKLAEHEDGQTAARARAALRQVRGNIPGAVPSEGARVLS